MKKAYLVCGGEWDDWRMVALFSNKEDADKCASILEEKRKAARDVLAKKYEDLYELSENTEYYGVDMLSVNDSLDEAIEKIIEQEMICW
jgi:hypothetical protein